MRKSSVIPTKRPAVNKTAAAIKEILSQFSFWCSSCETNGDLVYRNRPEYNGMTGRYYNKRRMVLECGCGAVHAERIGTGVRTAALGEAARPIARRPRRASKRT